MLLVSHPRTHAALLHGTGSLAVALLAAGLVFLLWYPWPYSMLAGGIRLFTLVVCVDLAIGPLATFLVYDRSKGWPVLRRDLAVLVALRLAALGFGLHVVFEARPAVLALEGQRFRLIAAADIVSDELPMAPPDLRALPIDGPRIVATQPPDDPEERFDTVQAALAGVDLGQRPRYWRPWDDDARHEALASCRSLDRLQALDARQRAEVDVATTTAGRSNACYLPLLARHGEWIVLLDTRNGSITGFANVIGD